MSTFRKHIDIAAERTRIQNARVIRVSYEAEWGREPVYGGACRLTGPFGELLTRQIQTKFAPGPRNPILKPDGTPTGRYYSTPIRWAQMYALVDPSSPSHPSHQAERKLSLLYRRPINVKSDICNKAWSWLRDRCGLDTVLAQRQSIEIMGGSAAVLPTLLEWAPGRYYPPSLTVIHPDECMAFEDPGQRGAVAIFILLDKHPDLRRTSGCTVWDVSDPSNPVYGRWASPEDYRSGNAPLSDDNGEPFKREGEAYPWWDGLPGASEPVMPATCSKWSPKEVGLLPGSVSDVYSISDLILRRMWADLVSHAGSFQRAIVLSDSPVAGASQSMMDPTNLLNLVGGGEKSVEVIPDSTEAGERHWNNYRDRFAEWAAQYDLGIEVKDGSSAKSGRAILLEMTGILSLAQQMETKARAVDTKIINALRSTWNGMLYRRELSLAETDSGFRWTPAAASSPLMSWLIPGGNIEIEYPRQWTEGERQQIHAELEKAVTDGREYAEVLWLFEQNIDNDGPGGPNFQAASEYLTGSLAGAMSRAAQGYGLRPETRFLHTQRTVEAEETRHDVPDDVAATASKGLNLRLAFPGRALVGLSHQNTIRLRRARDLRGQSPMLLGDVRALSTDLELIRRDREAQGDVDNDADPSGLYITWLTQGGDEAVAWTSTVLAGTAPSPEPAPLAEPIPEATP